MKLEKALKKYYAQKIRAAGPVKAPERFAAPEMVRIGAKIRPAFSLLNFATHIMLAALVIAGLNGFRHGSPLAALISQRAEAVSLDRSIECGLEQLNGYIKIFRKK